MFILFKIAGAELILETLWDIQECSGQPTLMTVFPNNASSVVMNAWSDGGYSYPYCGCDLVPLATGCCLSSIDISFTLYFQSASYSIDSNIPKSYFWKDANAQYYCYYKSIGGYLDWGYTERYIKPNGKCYDGMVCNQNELKSYYTFDCTGEYQNYTLTSDLQIVSYLNTSIAVSNTIFSGGKVENMWTGYIPSAILVPTFHAPLEIVGMGCYIAAIALAVGVAYIEGKHFWLGARYIFLAQFIWIIWVIMNLSDWVVLYPNVLSYEIMQAVENCLYNIGSMTSVLATFGLLLNYFKVVDANRRMNGYLILWLIHIIFAGSCYLTALSYVSGYYAFLYTYWNDIYPLWNLFQFTLNTIPPLYIYLTIIKLYSTEKNVKFKKAVAKIIKNAPLIVTLLPLQILNSLVYMVLSVIIQYTQILGNDRNFLGWNGLLCLANVNHEVFNLLLMTNLTNLVDKVNLKNKAKVPTESSTKSSALATLQNTQKKVEI